ncbi:MAG TPA: biopolymer transporter ExbD [Blastocatellia bacterium]|nr:biopolymer transporter ExbD [Blastocatellia bacterium]
MANEASSSEGPFQKKRRVRIAPPYINVTPMIDVLLVLLIIFMIIAPTKPARFETKIPTKPQDNSKVQPPTDLLMVVVKTGSSGMEQQVELNSHSMQLPELGTTLKDLLDQRPDKTVFIKAPKDKQYGDIVSVIDVVKGAGASPIGLQIDYLQ